MFKELGNFCSKRSISNQKNRPVEIPRACFSYVDLVFTQLCKDLIVNLIYTDASQQRKAIDNLVANVFWNDRRADKHIVIINIVDLFGNVALVDLDLVQQSF